MTDVDECSLNYCDQTCTNTIGSFVCECDIGFELGSDLMTCSGTYICTCISVFDKLISCTIDPNSSYLALHSSISGPDGAVNYDYIVSLLIGSRCIPKGAHTNHCWANLAHTSKHIKTSLTCIHTYKVYKCECIICICIIVFA